MNAEYYIKEIGIANDQIKKIYRPGMSTADPRYYVMQGISIKKELMRHNLKKALCDEALPVILTQALSPYVGKAIGEKRREGIERKAAELIGHRCRMVRQHAGLEIIISINGIQPFTFYIPNAFENGKLNNLVLPPSEDKLIEDYDSYIMTAEKRISEIMDKFDELNRLITTFNQNSIGYDNIYLRLQ